MREVAPGDLVFSFVDTRIVAIGTVTSYCHESPKTTEFGGVGPNWEAIGWRVRVNFISFLNRIRPKDHIDVLRRVLPSRYSPLQDSGNGIQSVYLTEVPMAHCETPPRWQVATPSSRNDRPIDTEVLLHRYASGLRKPAQNCYRESPAKIELLDLHSWR
jgi:hypothetical protein